MNNLRDIVQRLRQGEGIRAIARDTGLSRHTVRKYHEAADKRGWLAGDGPAPEVGDLAAVLRLGERTAHMRSSVEPFAELVKAWREAGVERMAIFQRLRSEYGYTGSYSSLRRFVASRHPSPPEAFCRVETAPGEEAQVDFGSAGWPFAIAAPQADGKPDGAGADSHRRVWVFVMTLSWSRHQYIEFVWDQKIETFLGCHERAFLWFGGVPRRIVVDNLKAAVTKASLHDPVLGEPYRRLAQHYGFLISPNRPYTPRHKGKVESGVHFVERNFLAGQVFAGLDSLNERGRRWVLEVAGVRRHGTTRQAPLERFQATERAALQPLCQDPFDLLAAYRAKVHHDCHVVVQERYYSVPYRFVGQTVEVYVGRRLVEIFYNCECLTTHLPALEPGQRRTRPEHYPPGKREYLDNPPERCRERAQAIGQACAAVVQTLLSERPCDRLRSVQGLLRLKERVGAGRLEAACQRALVYGDMSYRRVKSILDAKMEDAPLESDDAPPDPCVANTYRFARPALEFLAQEARP